MIARMLACCCSFSNAAVDSAGAFSKRIDDGPITATTTNFAPLKCCKPVVTLQCEIADNPGNAKHRNTRPPVTPATPATPAVANGSEVPAARLGLTRSSCDEARSLSDSLCPMGSFASLRGAACASARAQSPECALDPRW